MEYQDGFGPPGPLEDMVQRFRDEAAAGLPVKALHVGTPAELEQTKADADIKRRLAELEGRVNGLEPAKSDLLHLPTPDEVKEVCG